MKTQKEINSNIKSIEEKLKEHEGNYKKFGWHIGMGQQFISAENTKSYMLGWINALKWAKEG